MSKKVLISLIILTLTVIVGFITVPGLISKKGKNPVASEPEKKSGLPVNGLVIRYDSLNDYIKSSGSLIPDEEVALTTERAGKVQKINFKEGDRVFKGQVLVILNNAEYLARLKRLGYSIQLREQQVSRQEQLLSVGGISQEEYEITLSELNSLKAEREEVKAVINNSVITAPFTGIIGLRYVSEGSYLTPGESIAQLVSTNPIKIEFSLPGSYAGRVKTGDILYFENEDMKGKAEIYAIEPKVEQETRTIKIRAKTSNKHGRYVPGMFVNLRLVLSTFDTAIMVPSQALIPQQNGFMIYVKSGGQAVLREVKIGKRTPDRVQVIQGLNPGDTVLTTGMLQLNEGMKVTVTNL